MAVDNLKRLGYGGSAVVDGVQVLFTSADLTTTFTSSYLTPLDIEPVAASRSRVLHAQGIEAYSGNVAFDVTQNFMSILTISKLFARRYQFSFGFNDGEDSKGMEDCYVTSLTVSGSAGGLISASLSMVSASKWTQPAPITVPNSYIGFQGGSTSNYPRGYWHSGNTNVKDWSLSMNQDAVPIYLNQDTPSPRYIRVGMISFSLQVSTYEELYPYSPDPTTGSDNITILTSSFTLTGKLTNESASFNGPSDLGGYVHMFETAASASGGSGAVIITSP
jgi:hypothetical protein